MLWCQRSRRRLCPLGDTRYRLVHRCSPLGRRRGWCAPRSATVLRHRGRSWPTAQGEVPSSRCDPIVVASKRQNGPSKLRNRRRRRGIVRGPRSGRTVLDNAVVIKGHLTRNRPVSSPMGPKTVLCTVRVVAMHAAHLTFAPIHGVRPIERAVGVLEPNLTKAVELLVALDGSHRDEGYSVRCRGAPNCRSVRDKVRVIKRRGGSIATVPIVRRPLANRDLGSTPPVHPVASRKPIAVVSTAQIVPATFGLIPPPRRCNRRPQVRHEGGEASDRKQPG